jgi:SAM-dependent methyltransferase
MMAARDPHRYVNELGDAEAARLVDRLESRAKDSVFTRLIDKYAQALAFAPGTRIVEVGCGTGATLRRLVRRDDFRGVALGIDHSQKFIAAAKGFAAQEGSAGRVDFRVGDAHRLEIPDGTFDIVIAHTLISHVEDPAVVLREMARIARPGGRAVVFDGDYASMTFAHPDHAFGARMDAALVAASFNNPRIMRDLPALMPRLGLTLESAWGDAVTEIGEGRYFPSFAETYAPFVVKAGLSGSDAVAAWLAHQRAALAQGTFFAACVYYTFIAQRAS